MHDEVEAPSVVSGNPSNGCIGGPLLRHDVSFGPNGLSQHLDPCPLEDEAPACQQDPYGGKLQSGRPGRRSARDSLASPHRRTAPA